ncbi:hypothetical protein H6S82_03115 [Planktothrix sp. FACHB-1355]|uniref:Uncharacterized protein n=1 Tax=Aerosakkonema funiforme FACHB-1375 TaxID=2949571 RepID=A0A926VHI0_9CYAN|nr:MULTISPECIES: hypothetical protein [Oscillatoriales]MBD2184006.1 hypothetical protein [Aerosakkonema funiforme FACHB-1375]MBD3557847.1 hypothetical protein [Planktothrix sp. FACHB-1355]
MLGSISKYIGVDSKIFAQTGAFDAILDVDSKLFIDPHLLKSTQAPELSGSYGKFCKRFEHILKLLANSRHINDVLWKEADRKFTFSEVQGLCIGYCLSGTSGSGMGVGIRTNTLNLAKQIVDLGINDPEIFELMGLFQDGIGADRISDMVGRIIVDDLLEYSRRIFSNFGLRMQKTVFEGRVYEGIVNPVKPHNNSPLILLPKDILRDEPVAYCWENADKIFTTNKQLRQNLNAAIGKTWKEVIRRFNKKNLRELLLEDPELLKDLIENYKNKPFQSYNFDADINGEIVWYEKSQYYVQNYPLESICDKNLKPENLLSSVLLICQKFKDLIEKYGLSEFFYIKNSKETRKESAAQKLFYGIAYGYSLDSNLVLNLQNNTGRLAIEFQTKPGRKKVLVETKLTTNSRNINWFKTQIADLQQDDANYCRVYIFIDILGGSRESFKALQVTLSKILPDQKKPEVIFINARPKYTR